MRSHDEVWLSKLRERDPSQAEKLSTTKALPNVRVRWSSSPIPSTAKLLIKVFEQAARARTAFTLDGVPMTANNQYFTNEHGHRILDSRIKEWRREVHERMRTLGIQWNPRGVVAGIIVFESSMWVTKKHTVRRADADNRIKPTFDAVAEVAKVDDATLWEGHFYKLFGRREKTHVWLFDLGDVVEGSKPA